MDEIDMLLSIVENPTRRRILESLVREPSYPLRLSKELGISQQAVMKNLALLEGTGLVESSRVSSDMGPMRLVYTPSGEFTIVVDMHSGVFSVRMLEPSVGEAPEGITIEEAEARLKEIDERVLALDQERRDLIAERNAISESMKREAK